MTIEPKSIFSSALPYGVATLAAGGVGIGLALTCTSTAAIVAAVALAVLGAYAFIGVITCSVASLASNHPFQENIFKHMATSAGAGMSGVIMMTVNAIIENVVRNVFDNRRRA